jgi:hypothetical protein
VGVRRATPRRAYKAARPLNRPLSLPACPPAEHNASICEICSVASA